MGIHDDYTAFCFDEACAFILAKMNDGEEPILRDEKPKKSYSRPSEFYNKFK